MDELSIYQPNEIIRSNVDVIQIEDLPPYEIQDYDVFDEKDFKKYINDVKKTVRNSLEYRQFIQYLRNYMHMNEDSFFESVTNAENSRIKIEIHHTPYSLEDIVVTVFNKRVFYGEDLDVEETAKEVMYIHYFLMVGLIPLSTTVHELVHNNLIFIPTNKVMGNYKEFEETYKHWIPEEVKEKVKAREDRTLTYNEDVDMALLMQKQIPIQLIESDSTPLLTMNNMQDIMNQRIQEIRYQNSHALPDNSITNTYDNIKPELIRGVTYDI
jgi:hypothetical protein